MFNNAGLDVVIGLVFIYLLYSLLGTLLQEIIAANLGLRGLILRKAIRRMLDDDPIRTGNLFQRIGRLFGKAAKIVSDTEIPENTKAEINTTIQGADAKVGEILQTPESGKPPTVTKLSRAFYGHPVIKYFRTKSVITKTLPAYIDKETFSKVMIDLLRGSEVRPGDSFRPLIQKSLDLEKIAWTKGVNIEGETLSYLRSLWADAQGDVARFKASLEQWFDEMMDRTTGWYKKYTQWILLVVGLGIAIGFNVDTLKIAAKLQKNPKIREQLVGQATQFTKDHPNLDSELLARKQAIDAVPATPPAQKDSMKIVLGKTQELRDSLVSQANALVKNDITTVNNLLGLGWDGGMDKNFQASSIVGWLLTALAISLGAPFWFDLLNRLMKLRSSVSPDDGKTAKSAKPDNTPKQIERVG